MGEFIFFAIPGILIPAAITLTNCSNLFSKQPSKTTFMAEVTLIIGLLEYGLLFGICFNQGGDGDMPIYTNEVHNVLNSEYLVSFLLPCIAAIVALMILELFEVKRLPPLVGATLVATVLLGNVMNVLFAIQILEPCWRGEVWGVLFYVFHINVLLISLVTIRRHIRDHVKWLQEKVIVYRHAWVSRWYKLMGRFSGMSLICFGMMFPVALIMWIVLLIMGQGVDGFVQVFTKTADWTFSTQIPPPPIQYPGHYLCTVAAGGHKRVVKPLRPGKRLGHPIVVNRQLCIANAFEELIRERMPRFHKKVRSAYDTYGYPLSKVITTPFRADVVYLLMKPPEWGFLLVLYLFDCNPEQRIARQYEWK